MFNFVFEEVIADPASRVAHYRAMVESYYDRVTDAYRAAWGESFHFAVFQGDESIADAMVALERSLSDEGGFRPGLRVLDVGCGIGGPALTIAAHSGAQVTGLNLSPKQVEVAKQRAAEKGLANRADFVLGDAMQMPFADASFDHVYLFESGCHMPDKGRFVAECARVLKPGGLFLGYDWMGKDGLTPTEWQRYLEPICRYHSLPHLATLSETEKWLKDAGLEVQLIEDVATRGDILPNWQMLDEKTIAGIRELPAGSIPPDLEMLTSGGIALATAARAGAFLIGHWRARKPA